jgi:hypothetical protein
MSAVSRRVAIEDRGFIWTLTVRNKRSNGLFETVRIIVIHLNTCVSPKRKHITRK